MPAALRVVFSMPSLSVPKMYAEASNLNPVSPCSSVPFLSDKPFSSVVALEVLRKREDVRVGYPPEAFASYIARQQKDVTGTMVSTAGPR